MKLVLDILHSEHLPVCEQSDSENTLEEPRLFITTVLFSQITADFCINMSWLCHSTTNHFTSRIPGKYLSGK